MDPIDGKTAEEGFIYGENAFIILRQDLCGQSLVIQCTHMDIRQTVVGDFCAANGFHQRLLEVSADGHDFAGGFHFSPADLPYIKAIYTALLPLVESCAYYSLDQDLDGISLPHYAYGFVTLGNGIDELSELYLDHEQIQEAYIVDCASLLLLSKAYEEFAHVIEDQSSLSLAELSFLGDTYSLDLLPQIYERLTPDAIGLTEGQMLLPLKTAALILHLDTNTHADLKQLCNTCSTCKNLSCPSRKSPLQDLPHTYGAMQIFHIT